jgi:micrococcal nuclease
MFKRFTMVLLTILASFSLFACEQEEEMSDGEFLRSILAEVSFDNEELTEDITVPTIEEDGVTATWTSSNATYLTNDGVVTRPEYYKANQDVSLTLVLEKNGVIVNKVYNFRILKEDPPAAIELNTDNTDELPMNFAYENTDFIEDGVGEVTLVRCVDGDTAIFTEGNDSFSVRFLGINTPESTSRFEPWGKAASDYTCDKLENASQIVLQADPESGRLDSYGERWLAWVWYDGRLLNLELVEQAYSKASGGINTYYGELIYNVSLEVGFSDRRVWGETDPDFDYSLDGIQLTLEELVTNQADYVGLKVAFTGIVSRVIGGAAFIQQDDYGIYVYNRAWAPDLTVGNEVQLSGVTVTYYPDENSGALQVSGYQKLDPYSVVVSKDNEVEPAVVTIDQITEFHIGSLLQVEHLTITNIYDDEDAFTITAEDASGTRITIRKDAAVSANMNAVDDNGDTVVRLGDAETGTIVRVGDTITVVAPLSRYNSNYQLMVSLIDDITIEE